MLLSHTYMQTVQTCDIVIETYPSESLALAWSNMEILSSNRDLILSACFSNTSTKSSSPPRAYISTEAKCDINMEGFNLIQVLFPSRLLHMLEAGTDAKSSTHSVFPGVQPQGMQG